jgi:DNA-binding NarL/FixJ family response regulator
VPKFVLIVDDNAGIRKAMRTFFEAQPELEVCGEAINGRDAIEKARLLHPDLIILDFSMPVMNGLEAAYVLQRILPAVPLVMYTLHKSLISSSAASAGISAVVAKEEGIGTLVSEALTLLRVVPRESVFKP